MSLGCRSDKWIVIGRSVYIYTNVSTTTTRTRKEVLVLEVE